MKKGFSAILVVGFAAAAFAVLVSTYYANNKPETNISSINLPSTITKDATTFLPEDECQLYTRKSALDKSQRENLHPTKSGDNRIDLKFREGSGVRLRDGKFVSMCDKDLSEIDELLGKVIITRLFSQSEESLDYNFNKLRENNPDIEDLNLWYVLTLPNETDFKTVDNLINKLNEFELVEIAYPHPQPAPLP